MLLLYVMVFRLGIFGFDKLGEVFLVDINKFASLLVTRLL